jgi:hypothetical protein
MNDATSPNRWFQAWRSQPREAQLDPADLGTAFGLDASFDEAHCAARPAPSPAKPGWMRRLSSRGQRPA